MSSMLSALQQAKDDLDAAIESNKKFGITRGMRATVTGEVYFAGATWQVVNKPAKVLDRSYPSTVFVCFDDLTTGYVAKESLTPVNIASLASRDE